MQPELTPELILAGYRAGIFPMGDETGEIFWLSPDPRAIIEFGRFHVPRTVRQLVARGVFEVRRDTGCEQVIAACAERAEGTWITPVLLELYCELHRQGHVHSVEAWEDDRLVGGLYGVAIGGAFFGESMFHRVSGASKVALVALMRHLAERGFVLVDTQWTTPHLARFGTIEIPRREYLRRLRRALELPCRFNEPRDG